MLYEKVSKRTPQQSGQALKRTWLQSVSAWLKPCPCIIDLESSLRILPPRDAEVAGEVNLSVPWGV